VLGDQRMKAQLEPGDPWYDQASFCRGGRRRDRRLEDRRFATRRRKLLKAERSRSSTRRRQLLKAERSRSSTRRRQLLKAEGRPLSLLRLLLLQCFIIAANTAETPADHTAEQEETWGSPTRAPPSNPFDNAVSTAVACTTRATAAPVASAAPALTASAAVVPHLTTAVPPVAATDTTHTAAPSAVAAAPPHAAWQKLHSPPKVADIRVWVRHHNGELRTVLVPEGGRLRDLERRLMSKPCFGGSWYLIVGKTVLQNPDLELKSEFDQCRVLVQCMRGRGGYPESPHPALPAPASHRYGPVCHCTRPPTRRARWKRRQGERRQTLICATS